MIIEFSVVLFLGLQFIVLHTYINLKKNWFQNVDIFININYIIINKIKFLNKNHKTISQ